MSESKEEKKEEVPLFSLDGIVVQAKVVDCYDGDTITCVFNPGDISEKKFRWKCRLIGIDTPEIRSRNKDDRERAIVARDYLRSLILDKEITLECSKFDKYGRVLVNVKKDDLDVNKDLVEKGHAVEFSMRRKRK